MGRTQLGVDLQGLAVLIDRRVNLAFGFPGKSEVVVGDGRPGIDMQGPPVVLNTPSGSSSRYRRNRAWPMLR